MKQKYNALKRNYESVSFHSANDSLENVRLQRMREEFENQIKSLQYALAQSQDSEVALKASEKTLQEKQKELLT